MKNKLFLIFICLILLSISTVSAGDINQTNIDDADNSVLSTSNNVIVDTLSASENDNLTSDEGEYIDVNEAYDSLNAFRTEDNVWQWNEDDATKTYFNTNDNNMLKPLARDITLEQTAKIRAKELVQLFDHTRPDGTICFTAFPTGLLDYGENIAYGYTTCESVTEGWKETNDFYDGQGHRRNMLYSGFNCVGIAGYKVNGVIYWVQDFGYSNNIITDGNKTIIDGSFSDLNRLIQNSTNTIIKLEKNYTYIYQCDWDLKDGIIISKPITIDGQGHTINALEQARIFKINEDNVTLKNINFINGHATSLGGGAIYCDNSNNFTIFESNFTNNNAEPYDGGAIYVNAANYTVISNCNFKKNTASTSAGAIEFLNCLSNIITNCSFIENYAWNRGAIFGSDSTITDCIFINNSAAYGGAIGSEQSIIKNSIFINNSAICGGAILAHEYISIFNNIFINNDASWDLVGHGGSAIYLSGTGYGYGYGNISNNIFIDNKGKYTIKADDYFNYKHYFIADYNWWGNNATNHNSNPLTNFDVNKWFYLNMTIKDNLAIISLNNLYDNVTKSIQKYKDCELPDVKFTLNSNNTELDIIIHNGTGNLLYDSNNHYNITAKYYSTSISNNPNQNIIIENIPKGDFDILQSILDKAPENSIINLERDYNYDCEFDTITEGIVINKKVTINGNGHTINAQGKSRIFKIKVKDVVFNNLTLINGNISTAGGAIYVHHFGSVSLVNSTLINNSAVYGRAIYNHYGSSVFVVDSIFINKYNASYSYSILDGGIVITPAGENVEGGAIYSNCGNISIVNSSFINNNAFYGGVLYNFDGNTSIVNSSFINNSAFYGGALESLLGNISIVNSSFINNSAFYGGAISCEEVNLFVMNSSFINNSALDGGAIWLLSNNILFVMNSSFINNSALGGGGAISAISSYNDNVVSVMNSIFINNTVNNNDMLAGGAIHIYEGYNLFVGNSSFINNSALGDGGGAICHIKHHDDLSDVINSSFINNSALGDGGGAISIYGTLSLDTTVRISNSLFENNKDLNNFAVANYCDHVILKNNTIDNLIWNNGNIASSTSIVVLNNKTITTSNKEFILNATIYDDNGNIIVCSELNFIVNNQSISGILEKDNFRANVTLEDDVNVINATSVYGLLDNNTVKIGIISVTQDIILILCQDIVKSYGSSNQLVVFVTKNGSPFSNAEIKINLNGSTYTRTTDKEGKAYLPINLDSGVYDAIVTYLGSGLVPAKVVKITIKTLDTVTDLSYVKNSDDSVTLTANVNQSSASGNIVFDVNDVEYISEISNSKAVCTLSNLESGSYMVKAYYSGDINHKNSTSNSISFIIENNKVNMSAPDLIKYYGGTERFIVTLKDKNNKAIANESVSITINGKSYTRTTNNDGEASIAINLNYGVYPVTTEYKGQKIDSKVTVISTIQGKDITKIFRNDTQYYATFLDNKGNFLKNTDVTFNINGVFYTRTTNDKGVAKLNINLQQGDYIITATNPVTHEQRSNIVKVLPLIIENNNITKYYKNGTQYVVKVLNLDGSVAGAGVNVTFNINGVFYTRTTNASGHAKLNINLAPGEYIITAEYNDLRVSNKIKVLPVLSAENLIMSYKDGSKFEAKLLDGQGNAYASQIIKFNINGVFYDRNTDANGIAKLNINLMSGKYIITSMYNGAAISNEVTIR